MANALKLIVAAMIVVTTACGAGDTPAPPDSGWRDAVDAAGQADTPDSMRHPDAEDLWGGEGQQAELHRDSENALAGDSEWQPLPGEAGYPCTSAGDCNEGYCIQTSDGMQCTQTCTEECPFGWRCALQSQSGTDQIYICVPGDVALCRPCMANSDCWVDDVDAGQACISYGPAGFFCGAQCSATEDCSLGYVCQAGEAAGGGTLDQCVLAAGECECKKWFVDDVAATTCYLQNEFGLCHGGRTCLQDGLSKCDALTPTSETCNGLDDNCDQQVDEDTGGGTCVIANEYGKCDGIEQCVSGQVACNGPTPQPEICDGLDNDCNGSVDEGFPDTDGDGIKDCLVSDKDGDGVLDVVDNCPNVANTLQADFDLDGSGDVCDLDDDNDLVADAADCAPLDPDVSPDTDEVCNGIDDNCDYLVDEGFFDTDSDKLADCVDGDDDNDLVPDAADCEPLLAAAYPGAEEICDGLDNDCDNAVDEVFADTDQDGTADCVDQDDDGDGLEDADDNCPGHENPAQEDQDMDSVGDVCDLDLDGDSIPNGTDNCPQVKNTSQNDVDKDDLGDDCDLDIDGDGALNQDDNCPLVDNPGQEDFDDNGVGDACETDKDGDGAEDSQDCAPFDPGAYPGADEICDETDNDCDGLVDEGFTDTDADLLKDCVDDDDDNDGDPDQLDCAPTDPAVSHSQQEKCDGLDNDCNGAIDDGLGFQTCGLGECLHKVQNCVEGQQPNCNPFAGAMAETCDGKDNDCDGIVDEDLGTTSCGLGQCWHTVSNCVGGEPVLCDVLTGAADEICDGIDNDCDGKVDEDQSVLACGKGQCFHTTPSCIGGVETECDPFAGAGKEVCDDVDNDCDGSLDEDLGSTTCGLGECEHTVDNCLNGVPQMCNPLIGAAMEECDDLDNDCDGIVDEDLGLLSCGLGQCEQTVPTCIAGVPQECNPLAGATEEECDKIDNDCDGEVDEDFPDFDNDLVPDCLDNDDDQDGDPDATDCDDFNPAVGSNQAEVCFNGGDDDCDPETPDECVLESCKAILAVNPAAQSGIHTIDADGDGDLEPFEVQCDMTFDNGGWTVLSLDNSNSILVGSSQASNPWRKCGDDVAKYYTQVNGEGAAEEDYIGGATGVFDTEVALEYANPASGQAYSAEQVQAMRGQVDELSSFSRMVATTGDDDGYSWQDGQGGGHEVYVKGTAVEWFLLTPGTNQECGNSSGWPQGGSQSAFYLWSTDPVDCLVDGTTGINSPSLGGLPATEVLPSTVRLVVQTGGGVSFGWEKATFMVR